jgi:lysophospholipase L1-like esterase
MRKTTGLLGAAVACLVGVWLLRPTAPPATDAAEGFLPAIPEACRLRHEHHLRRIRGGPIDLALFGDSLMRGWEDHDDLWHTEFEPRRAGLFATTGDTTSNLLWRLRNGEADGYEARQCVVLIGINNRKHHSPAETAAGIAACVTELKKRQPKAAILLHGLLPQGRSQTDGGRRFVNAVNEPLATMADVRFVDLGQALLEADGTMSEAISPDGTHLTKAGYERWWQALKPLLDSR